MLLQERNTSLAIIYPSFFVACSIHNKAPFSSQFDAALYQESFHNGSRLTRLRHTRECRIMISGTSKHYGPTLLITLADKPPAPGLLLPSA